MVNGVIEMEENLLKAKEFSKLRILETDMKDESEEFLVRINDSLECIASIIRVEKISELGIRLAVTST
jgi:hypothetical protein